MSLEFATDGLFDIELVCFMRYILIYYIYIHTYICEIVDSEFPTDFFFECS